MCVGMGMGFFPGFDVWDEIGEVYKLKKPGCICGGCRKLSELITFVINAQF